MSSPLPYRHVVPIPLVLLLHPMASEFPYAPWLTEAQATHGGIRLPLTSAGFRNCFEYARAVIRSGVSDPQTRLEARRFAAEIYRINLKHYGTAPTSYQYTPTAEPSSSSSSTVPRKRAFEPTGQEPTGPPRRPTPQMRPRILVDDLGFGPPGSGFMPASSGEEPSAARALGLEDDDMRGGDGDDEHDRSAHSSDRERRVRLAGTSTQRAVAVMQVAKTTNMRGQWRDGTPLVPVPNSRGRPPPPDLPPLPSLTALHSLPDRDLAAWLRFYDGEDAEVPLTRFAREIALCSRLGVLWSPSAAKNKPLPTIPTPITPVQASSIGGPLAIETQQQGDAENDDDNSQAGPASAPPSCTNSSPPSLGGVQMTRSRTAPIIRVIPPTPPSSPSPDSPFTEPPATPPHQFPQRLTYSYSYGQTHPISHAYTHRYRRYSVASDTGSEASSQPPRMEEPAVPVSPVTPPPLPGYKYVIRHGVPYAVRWVSHS